MTKRIFHAICFVALGVFFACAIVFMGMLYDYFGGVRRSQLKNQTELAARAVADEGMDFLKGLDAGEYRITWVDKDGTVLYDTKTDSADMENHLEREEIQEAFADGYGESSRYSATLMERTLYCAKRLPDGTALRLSVSQNTLLTLFLGMAQPVCMIILMAVILSLVFASRLSEHIVAPLNRLNLEEPLSNEGYDELSPLLRRIDAQQRQIKYQSDELRRQRREFETVTENMAEGIILLNADGTVLSINRSAEKLFGTNRACIGKHILSVNRSAELSDILRRFEDGQHAEKVVALSGGRYQLNINPVITEGTVSGAVLLALNVTEKENAEQMRREFTANVSHELKTPLHTIAGCAELLANGMVQEKDTMLFYRQIQAQAERMIRLVEDIIRLSHLDEGAYDMKREETDLYALAKETMKTLSAEAARMDVAMTLEGEAAVMQGIPQLLQSIVYNLCDNAIKYNRAQGSVTVTVKNNADAVSLSVTDTGIGIPPEHQQRIFERFYRVDKSRSKELGGTGLGLSIVRHAAKLHHAQIELKSVEDSGTTVTVMFPNIVRVAEIQPES